MTSPVAVLLDTPVFAILDEQIILCIDHHLQLSYLTSSSVFLLQLKTQ